MDVKGPSTLAGASKPFASNIGRPDSGKALPSAQAQSPTRRS